MARWATEQTLWIDIGPQTFGTKHMLTWKNLSGNIKQDLFYTVFMQKPGVAFINWFASNAQLLHSTVNF